MATLASPPQETLPEFMRRMRERKGLTQDEIVGALPVKLRQYQSYETGTVTVPREHYPEIARAFGVSEDVIVRLADGQPTPPDSLVVQSFWEIAAIIDRVRASNAAHPGEAEAVVQEALDDQVRAELDALEQEREKLRQAVSVLDDEECEEVQALVDAIMTRRRP